MKKNDDTATNTEVTAIRHEYEYSIYLTIDKVFSIQIKV